MGESEVKHGSSSTDRPGRRLEEARKALGLSIEEVASRLRLNVNILQALEKDDHRNLPPAAFVSGYLRAYARILGLSEAEITRGAVSAPGSEPILGAVARGRTGEVRASDPSMRIISYVIIGGLFLVSSVWWLSQPEEGSSAPAQEVVAGEENASVVNESSVPEAGATASESTGAVPVPAVEATPALATEATSTPPVALSPEPKVEVPPKPKAPPPPPLTPETPQSKITLETTADCWVDVVDAAGRQLAYAVSPAGRKLTLRGEAPFKVFFGYSPGVQVYFNDQLFDHRPFQRGDTARFKLGTAEDNALLTEAQ